MKPYTIITDAVFCSLTASDADEACRKFATSERIVGVSTLDDLVSHYAAIEGAELLVSDADGHLARHPKD